jgi:hypothetical protein
MNQRQLNRSRKLTSISNNHATQMTQETRTTDQDAGDNRQDQWRSPSRDLDASNTASNAKENVRQPTSINDNINIINIQRPHPKPHEHPKGSQ